jgi:O-antigen/teichoic acid export membrane protein
MSFLTGLLIARALGVTHYGNLNFLLGSFAAMNLLLDAGTTPAFYTFLSRQKQPPVFFAFYLAWTLGVQMAGSLIILVLAPQSIISGLWLGQSRGDVLLAFCASFTVSQIWLFVTQLGEASRKTVIVQAITVLQAVLHLCLVVAFWAAGFLSVRSALMLQTVEIAVIAILVSPRLMRLNLRDDPAVTWRHVAASFVEYCRPLVFYGFIAFLYAFADRWLLQRFGGAQQQGYYAIGQQFSAIGLLATSAVLNVFWKEVADANARNDVTRLRAVYRRVRHAVFLVGAWSAALLIPYSSEILTITVGSGFASAALPLSLMFLFSVHQSLGQLQGAFFKAMGETRAYTVIGTMLLVTSIPVTYFMLAPRSAAVPGAGLGGSGLALKMVVLQLIGVTVEGLWLIRRFGVAPDFGYQAAVLGGAVAISYAVKLALNGVLQAVAAAPGPLAVCLTGGLSFALISALVMFLMRDRLDAIQMLIGQVQALRLRSSGSK